MTNGSKNMVKFSFHNEEGDDDRNSIGGWVFFKVFGQPFLILGDLSKTTDLFETRSSIYSSRVTSTMISEL